MYVCKVGRKKQSLIYFVERERLLDFSCCIRYLDNKNGRTCCMMKSLLRLGFIRDIYISLGQSTYIFFIYLIFYYYLKVIQVNSTLSTKSYLYLILGCRMCLSEQ